MLEQKIHNYKIISLLGEGGMANVYLVEHEALGLRYALKLLKEEFVQHPNIRKRFLAEAKNLAKMQHPNVIKVTDLIDAGDIVAFVMEYVEGVSLEEYISQNAPLKNEIIESLFNQMINAVEYVHSQDLIHRDIKPSNFMVTPQGTVKLLDFGIAKNLNDNLVDYTRTSLAQQMGTPMYMSPEQVRNTTEITKQTDIYSLGVVLWQMVVNKKPYDSEVFSLPEIQVSILREPLPLTDSIWDSKILQATDKEPLKRGLENISAQEFEFVSDYENNIENPTSNNLNYKIDPKAFGVLILIFIILIWVTYIIIQKENNQSIETVEDTNPEVVVTSKKSEKQPEINKTETNEPNEVSKVTSKADGIPEKVIEKPIEAKVTLQIGQKYQGGIIFELDDSGEHGKVCTEKDLGQFNWQDAKTKCDEMIVNGYSDWYLPSKSELKLLYNKNISRSFTGCCYWSSSEFKSLSAWTFYISNGSDYCSQKIYTYSVRAVRAF